MAKQTGKQAKPKCGAGQSCGYACIAAHETCTETIDPTISKAAVEALRGHATAASAAVASESTDFRGKSFDEVQSKFSANDAKHTIANTIVDHGEGITTQKVTLVASDGSGDTLTHTLLRMAAVPAAEGNEAQPERIFTLSDGAAKEYTDASKNNFWNESRDAAVRAAVGKPAEPTETKTESFSEIKPYKTTKTLGEGGFAVAVLTDRGTVVKTALPGKASDFPREAEMQARAADAGIAPKVLAAGQAGLEQELVKGPDLETMQQTDWAKDDDADLSPKTTRAGEAAGLAMMQLHAAGVVHNDLHEGNVMLDEASGKVRIIDYGTANSTDSDNYLSRGTRVEEFIRRKPDYDHPEARRVSTEIKPQLDDYKAAVLKAIQLDAIAKRNGTSVSDSDRQEAESNRVATLKVADDAYGEALKSLATAKPVETKAAAKSVAAKPAAQATTKQTRQAKPAAAQETRPKTYDEIRAERLKNKQ